MLRAAFKLRLRQAEGLLVSFIELLGYDLAVPEHATFSRLALVETTMGRLKTIIGPRLRAHHDSGRRTDAAVGAVVLNRMRAAGHPNSVPTNANG